MRFKLLASNNCRKYLVAKLACSGLGAEVVAAGVGSDIASAGKQFKVVPLGQLGDELLVGVGLFSPQLVIEVDDRKNNAKFRAQFEHDSQQGYGISSA